MTLEPTPGTVLDGKFRLDRLLGEGGMGSVWAATNLTTRKAVALKLLKGSASASALRRFVREARLAAMLQHPNVVAVHDVAGLADGLPALVMDLLQGETLRARLEREPRLPLAELARLLSPVVDALRLAHRSGIVHRDLKPDNLFLQRGPGGALKLVVLDFGIAKRVASEPEQEGSAPLTGTGDILGTFQYMAPEQLFGESNITGAADIWALGVILHECLCGERPFGSGGLAQVLREAVVKGKLPGLDRTLGAQPPELRALISSALSVVPGERPPLEQFEAVLLRYAGERAGAQLAVAQPSSAEEVSTPPALASELPREVPPELAHTVLAAPRPRWRRTVAVVSAAVSLAAGMLYVARQVLVVPTAPASVTVNGAREASLAALPISAAALSTASGQDAAPAQRSEPVGSVARGQEGAARGQEGAAAPRREPEARAAGSVAGPASGSPPSQRRKSRRMPQPAPPMPAQPSKTEFKPVKRLPF